MTADEFEARVALLEEHLIAPTAEDHLRKAEEFLARGDKFGRLLARHSLQMAKWAYGSEEDEDVC